MNNFYINKIIDIYINNLENVNNGNLMQTDEIIANFFKDFNLKSFQTETRFVPQLSNLKVNSLILYKNSNCVADEFYFDDFDIYEIGRLNKLVRARDYYGLLNEEQNKLLAQFNLYMIEKLEKLEKGLGKSYYQNLLKYHSEEINNKIEKRTKEIEHLNSELVLRFKYLNQFLPETALQNEVVNNTIIKL